MKVYVYKSVEELSKDVAKLIISNVNKNPKCVLGLATGNTMLPIYKELVKDYKTNQTNYENVKTFNLDEYAGLHYLNKNSYHYYMKKNLFQHININKSNIYIPNGIKKDLQKECDNYNELLQNYPVDLQLLGIGTNGHIGFNEPSTTFTPFTHIVTLKDSTILSNQKLFNKSSEVPKKALTMGIQNIMTAKHIILIATGDSKQYAVKKLLEEPISPFCPASILQKHQNVDIFLNTDSAKLLNKTNLIKKTA